MDHVHVVVRMWACIRDALGSNPDWVYGLATALNLYLRSSRFEFRPSSRLLRLALDILVRYLVRFMISVNPNLICSGITFVSYPFRILICLMLIVIGVGFVF